MSDDTTYFDRPTLDIPCRSLLIRGAEEWIASHGLDEESRRQFNEVADAAWYGSALMWGEEPRRDSRWIESLPNVGHFVYHLIGYKPGVSSEEAVEHIYVGVTSNLRSRMKSHSRKWWWTAVVPDLCYFDERPTRKEAEAEERVCIREDQPAMNRAGRLLVVTTI